MGFLSRGQKKHLRQRKQHMKKAWRGEMDICGAVRVINKGETDLGRVFALIITFFWIFLKLLSFSQWSHILINTLTKDVCTCQSVSQFSHSFMSHFLRPHGLQHARPPCLLPTPGACSNSCPLSRWCHPTISSSAVPFSSHLQSFPASGSFLMSQFFASGGQSTGVSASASVLPINIQDWFPLGWTGWISLQSKGLSRVFSNTAV